MKRISIIIFVVLVTTWSCNKSPESPSGGNKIVIGLTIADSISYQYSEISSTLSSNGGNPITQHGHCWSTTTNPTISDNHTSLGSLSQSVKFTSELSGLSENTQYYIRPYVSNLNGILYGAQLSISTLKIGKPVVVTGEATEITTSSVKILGAAVFDSGTPITVKGIIWDTLTFPTLTKNLGFTVDSSGMGLFTTIIDKLDEHKQYYYAVYATNAKGTSYGESKSFMTTEITIPSITTNAVTSITLKTATCGGNVISDGNGTMLARGVCWNKTGSPTLYNSIGYTNDGTELGLFTSTITGLTDGTDYYVVAYATNNKGTAYGEVIKFTTGHMFLPVVITSSVTNVTASSAQCGGNVTSDGNGTVYARGVCWNTTGNPKLGNCIGYTTDGAGTGLFISNLSGLYNGTTYFVTAYANNEKGTTYGSDVKQFVATDPPFQCGNNVNHGGKNYQTVKIGTQCWFKENLNIGTRIDGSNDQTNNGVIEKYCYEDNEGNCNTYGGLYQWDELMQFVSTQGSKGLCPNGWHIPTDAEWTTLTTYLGGESVAGGKMKEAGTSHWTSPNTGANNSSGFTVLPGGSRRNSGVFMSLFHNANYWSSSQNDVSSAWHRDLYYNLVGVYKGTTSKSYGFSCRCLLD